MAEQISERIKTFKSVRNAVSSRNGSFQVGPIGEYISNPRITKEEVMLDVFNNTFREQYNGHYGNVFYDPENETCWFVDYRNSTRIYILKLPKS